MTTTEAPVAPLARRHFTAEATRAYDTVDWELRNARIAHGEKVVFNQDDVEVPSFWGEARSEHPRIEVLPRHARHARARDVVAPGRR
ncbi:hypothetical protein B1B_12617, partial [mine drainage metagenome]